MAASTLLFIILFGIIAIGAALFFYFYKPQGSLRLRSTLTFLRFLSIFSILLLILNPTFTKTTYTTLKPKLALLVDNSESIANLERSDSVRNILENFKNNRDLAARFDLDYYTFGGQLQVTDSLSFTEKQTDISKGLNGIYSIYKNQKVVPVLVTDGNANLGSNYVYLADEHKQIPHYFIAVGDTTRYEDLSIDRINVNRYAYLKNRFPVEIVSSYSGEGEVATTVSILKNGRLIFKENLNFSKDQPAQRINTFLEASTLGTETYQVVIDKLTNEKNTANNSKNFGIEIIDQRSQILIVYSILHPDLGTLKKSFESNQLRSVTIKSISETNDLDLGEFNLVVLFEPQSSFSNLYQTLNTLNKNRFTIVSSATDRRFINTIQEAFRVPLNNQLDEVQPLYNPAFSSFQIDDLEFNTFSPITAPFGEIQLNASSDVILTQKITGIETQNPLLTVQESNGRREVVLFGTGIYQWRSQSYVNNQNFEQFDKFLEKLVQFAASDSRRTRLQVEYDRFYYGGSGIVLQAQYVDKNYVFDTGANLTLLLKNTETQETYESPLVLSRNAYQVTLPNMDPGNYSFKITEKSSGITSEGDFTVIEYNIEDQVMQADFSKMKTAAANTNALAVTLSQNQVLIDELLQDDRFIPVQRETIENVPLLEFWWLLLVIVLALSAEWFLRKYNGLI